MRVAAALPLLLAVDFRVRVALQTLFRVTDFIHLDQKVIDLYPVWWSAARLDVSWHNLST